MMHSAEETTYLIEVMPDAGINQDFTSRDVDVLVSRIKENLRLSGLKSRFNFGQMIRASPYRIPCELCNTRNSYSNSGNDTQLEQQQHHKQCHRHQKRRARRVVRSELDDSYERFQALLRNGALIKEAVKRLQTCPDDEDEEEDEERKRRATSTSATSTTLDSMDEEEDEDDMVKRQRTLC